MNLPMRVSLYVLASIFLLFQLACARSSEGHKRALKVGGEVMRVYQKRRSCPSRAEVEKLAEGGLCPSPALCLDYLIVEDSNGPQCGVAVVNQGKAGDIILIPASVWTTVDLLKQSSQ